MNLKNLIEAARMNGHKILAVDKKQAAYCPENGVIFPDPPEEVEWVKRYSEPARLIEDSIFSYWVMVEEADEERDCSEGGTYYKALDLPDDVKPVLDPFEEESKKWCTRLKDITGVIKEPNLLEDNPVLGNKDLR